MSGTISIVRTDAYVVVEVVGELDLEVSPQLTEALAIARREGGEDIVIDLSQTEFIDSSGLHILLKHADAAERAGGRLRLVAPPEPVGRIFGVSGTEGRFTWVPAPGVLQTSPLPHRVARHRAALAAIGQVADEPGGLRSVTRLVADAAGDGCVIARVAGRLVEPLAAAHRRPEAERMLQALEGEARPFAEATLCRRLLMGPVFLGERETPPLRDDLGPYLRIYGIGSFACVPVQGPGRGLAGVLGAARDAGGPPYDEEDRVFLGQVADVLAKAGPLARADAG